MEGGRIYLFVAFLLGLYLLLLKFDDVVGLVGNELAWMEKRSCGVG